MIIAPDPDFNHWLGFIVFVAHPVEEGADGLASYALGPFDDVEEAVAATEAAQRDAPKAFVRWCELREPAPVELGVRLLKKKVDDEIGRSR